MRSIPARSWLLVLVSAMAQLIPFPIAGPVPLWRRAFCWFCVAPLLCALLAPDRSGRRLSLWASALLGYLCGVLWYTGNCYWIYQTMHLYGGLPEPVSLGILVLFAMYLGLYLAAFGWTIGFLHRSYSASVVLCAVPFVWIDLELARARITGFPWDLLGYTQVDNSMLTLLAPLGGVMLLSFVIAAVGAVFAGAFLARKRTQRTRLFIVAIGVSVLLQAGCLYHPAPDAATHGAVLLQENLKVGTEGRELAPISAEEKYRQFDSWSLHPLPSVAAGDNAPYSMPVASTHDLIVWPEAPADFATSDPAFRSALSGLARMADAPVIAGSIGVDFDPAAEHGYHEFGSAAVFSADGSYLGRYDKIHRVPWGEYVPYKQLFSFAGQLISGVGNMEAGTQHTLFPLNGHRVGVFICYESIFGDEVREFAKDGAQVFVNISDDGWYGDSGAPWQHLDMARMRAIENRRWVLRDTNTGVTTSIDPHGRGVFTAPRHVRTAYAFPYDYRSDTTFYTRHGDWFAWLCALATLVLVSCALLAASVGKVKTEN